MIHKKLLLIITISTNANSIPKKANCTYIIEYSLIAVTSVSDYYTDKLTLFLIEKASPGLWENVILIQTLTYHRLHQFMFEIHWGQNGGTG